MIECVWKGSLYTPDGQRIEGTDLTDNTPWQPGWCFHWGYQLSNKYKNTVAVYRQPIIVMVPIRNAKTEHNATPFCIDSYPTSAPDGHWEVEVDMETLVEGYRPDITVTPSINCVGLYHGFLQHGLLTDDLEA